MDSYIGQAPDESSAASPKISMSDAVPDISRKRLRSPHGQAAKKSARTDQRRHDKNSKGNRKSRRGNSKDHGKKDFRVSTSFDRRQGKEPDSSTGKDTQDNEPKAIYSVEFSKEEIAEEARRPKRKVAVMIGYCGSGYSGLQVMKDVKTIESDLFGAFVAAGAISKANADEPKKVQLVRCARTDKGVHAAGNVLSVKLIIEDKDLVEKINSHLPSQVRVWGIEQTTSGFNAYHQCDSRMYEYLIPTYCFLPPHPKTFLGSKLEELALEANDVEKYKERQADVENFWAEAEETYVKPVLVSMDPELREQAIKSIFAAVDTPTGDSKIPAEQERGQTTPNAVGEDTSPPADSEQPTSKSNNITPLDLAARSIRAAYHQAKVAYRITPSRLEKVKSVFARYSGTHKYHNYTMRVGMNNPSCQRHIKSFVVSGDPFIRGDIEWLSLKVHGQSFMMHQIRKMVLMGAMIVRCGTHEARIQDSFDVPRLIIPRAPGMGLLLERPIFDAYNKFKRLKSEAARGEIEFERYKAEMEAFKDAEIYSRMWRDEAEQQAFANLFGGLDSLRSSQLLWVTSMGVDAVERTVDGAVDVGQALAEEEAGDADLEEG